MALLGHNFLWWNLSSHPSASHLCTKLGVACWLFDHCCGSAHKQSQPWTLYLATKRRYLMRDSPRGLLNLLPITCCLAFPCSTPSAPCMHNASKVSQPTIAKSIQHCQNYPNAPSSQKISQQSTTTISQCCGLSRSWHEWFCPWIMCRCFFSSFPATHTFFHLLKALNLGCSFFLANCFKENSICFSLTGAGPSAPPMSDKSLLS